MHPRQKCVGALVLFPGQEQSSIHLVFMRQRNNVPRICPCVTGSLGCAQDRLQPLEKVVAVGVLPKDRAALGTAANDMVQITRGIDAAYARHS